MKMMIAVALLACMTGCKSYDITIGADGSKHIQLTNVGFDTKLEGMTYKHDGTEFGLSGYGSESKMLELVTEVVKRMPAGVK